MSFSGTIWILRNWLFSVLASCFPAMVNLLIGLKSSAMCVLTTAFNHLNAACLKTIWCFGRLYKRSQILSILQPCPCNVTVRMEEEFMDTQLYMEHLSVSPSSQPPKLRQCFKMGQKGCNSRRMRRSSAKWYLLHMKWLSHPSTHSSCSTCRRLSQLKFMVMGCPDSTPYWGTMGSG